MKIHVLEDHCVNPMKFAHVKIQNEHVSGIIEYEEGYIFMLNVETAINEFEVQNTMSKLW